MSIASYFLSSPTSPISGSFDDVTFIPEPTTGLLLTLGLAALGMRRRFH